MPAQHVATFAVALLFAAIHISGRRFDFLGGTPRSVWLSMAGGISVAYVFVHVLPELAAHQQELLETFAEGSAEAGIESHVYLLALTGLMIFYGIDTMLRLHARRDSRGTPPGIFWTHLGAFALYNMLIGYLLVHREDAGLLSLLLFGFALGLHFVVNDQALREHHGHLYHARGRWLLGCAPILGWLIGISTEFGQIWISALFALLAGSVILNVLKEELPEDRESRFSAFAGAAAAYAALLVAVA